MTIGKPQGASSRVTYIIFKQYTEKKPDLSEI